MSPLSMFRRTSRTARHAASQSPTFVPAPREPEPESSRTPVIDSVGPNDELILLQGGSFLVDVPSGQWSEQCMRTLQTLVSTVQGHATVVIYLASHASYLNTLKCREVWSRNVWVGNVTVKDVVMPDGQDRDYKLVTDNGGHCDVVIITLGYLDSIFSHRANPLFTNAPHEQCHWQARRRVFTQLFGRRRNFPAFQPTDHEVDLILGGDSLPHHHLNVSRWEIADDGWGMLVATRRGNAKGVKRVHG